MAQLPSYRLRLLSINPFPEKARGETPLEWFKWAAIQEMAVSSNYELEVRNLLHVKIPFACRTTRAHIRAWNIRLNRSVKENRGVRNQEKTSCWENRVQKAREKGVLCKFSVGPNWRESSAFLISMPRRGKPTYITTEKNKSPPTSLQEQVNFEKAYDNTRGYF